MAANKVIDEIVISSDDEDDDIICDTTKPARCALCSWPVKDEAEDKRSHILSHFNPRYNTQIKHASELTYPSQHYNNFIRLHHQCFPKKFLKTQNATPKPEPDDDEEEEANPELQERTPEPEEPKESFECTECGRFFEKERFLKTHRTVTHDKVEQKSFPSKSEKTKENPVLEVQQEITRAIVCIECDQRFETKGGLNHHRSRKHGIYTRYYCAKCHKQLGKQAETHVSLVHVHGDFRCSACYYRAKHKVNVSQHISRNKHSVMHAQAKVETLDHTYDERLKQFKDQFIMNLADQQVPKKTKKQEKPTEKGKQQAQRPETARHRQSVDRDRKTALYCKECDYVFKPSLHLSVPSHLASVHLKQNTLFCSKCDYSTYYDMHQIKLHTTRIHGGKTEIRDERHTIEEKLKQLRDENIITVRIDAHSKMIKDDSRKKSDERETEVSKGVKPTANQEGNEMETESGEEQQGAKKLFCAHCERLFVSAERFKKHQELVKNMERLARMLVKFPIKGKKKQNPRFDSC